jgi:thioredoxin 1
MKQLFYFTAPWCVPCQSFGPTMDRINTSILSENKGDWAPLEKVNIDYEADRAKVAKVMNIPTVILTKNGQEVKRFVGVQSYDQVLEFIK